MPAKDRDGVHVSMPKDLKEQVMKEAARREMYISDLICEKILHSYAQETQERNDILMSYEAISHKLDHVEPIRAILEKLALSLETPKVEISSSPVHLPWMEPQELEAWTSFKKQWDIDHCDQQLSDEQTVPLVSMRSGLLRRGLRWLWTY